MKKQDPHRTISRRSALKLLLGAGALLASPQGARAETAEELEAKAAETQEEIDAAQAEYEQVRQQLEAIAAEAEALAIEQAKTLDKIYEVEEQIRLKQEEIDQTQAEIEQREQELADKQDVLSRRIASSYKSGGTDFLEVLLSSASFEELASNIYYLDKISQSDAALIADVKRIRAELIEKKAQLEEDKAELEERKAELEELNALQQQQLDAVRAKQDEVAVVLSGIDARVQELIAQHDEELLAAEQERERARKAAEEAAAAAAAASSGGGSSSGSRVDVSSLVSGAAGSAAAVVAATYYTPSPGGGLCAWWVTDVFENAGVTGGYISGNACDMYNMWCYSSDMSAIQPGMIVAVSTYPSGGLGRIYGHVGIYVGNGMVRENIGYINERSLSSWVADYSGYVTPRWGWLGGIVLS